MTSGTMHSERDRHKPGAAGPIPAEPGPEQTQPDLYRPYRTPPIIRSELDRTGKAIQTLETQLHSAGPNHDPNTDTARHLEAAWVCWRLLRLDFQGSEEPCQKAASSRCRIRRRRGIRRR